MQTFLPYEAGRLRRLGGEGRADATRAALLGFTAGRVPDTGQLRRTGQLPPWLGEEAVHVSHRSSLLRKDPAHYRRFFPTERTTCSTSGRRRRSRAGRCAGPGPRP